LFVEQRKYRKKQLSTCPEDRPLAIQFCANDPDILLQAALLVQDQCDAIDINLGCPQNIAKRGNYGAFLGEQWDIVKALVEKLSQNLSIPVFCKIRILDTFERTLEYAKMIEAAGCSLLTVHGRTKEQKGHNMGIADLHMIRAIKRSLSIPVLSNGNVRTFAECEESIRITQADGCMSACGLLKYPALFSGKDIPVLQLADEYLELCKKYPVEIHLTRGHMHKMLQEYFRSHTDLREKLNNMRVVSDCDEILSTLRYRIENGIDGPGVVPEVQEEERKELKTEEVVATENGANIARLFD